MREIWETKHGSPGFTELVYSQLDWDTDNSNPCKIIQITWCIRLEMLLLFGGTFSSSSSYKDRLDSCQLPIVVLRCLRVIQDGDLSSTGPEWGLRNTQTMREWHTAGIDRRLTVLVRVFNQDSQFLHTELRTGERNGKQRKRQKALLPRLKPFHTIWHQWSKRKST